MRIDHRPRWRAATTTASLLAVAVAVAACGSSSGTAKSNASSSASDPSTFGSVQISNCPSSATTTLSGGTITLGTSAPLSGPFAVAGTGVKVEQAYFNYLNQRGGIPTVDGKKKLKLVALDDAYDPARAAANARQLVEQDHVAGVVAMVGTPTASAAEPYLNEQCIPQMFPESGSSSSTLNVAHPFTSQVFTYVQEGNVLAQFIKAKYPHAKIALLYQDDEVGLGMRQGLTDAGIKIAAQQSYEPTDTTVASQMTTLASTKAPVFVDASFSVMCSQSLKDANSDGWHPVTMIGTSCGPPDVAAAPAAATTGGLFQATYLKPSVGADSDQKVFAAVNKAAGQTPGYINEVAYISVELVVDAIEHAKALTPLGIARAATQLPPTPPGMFAPGVRIGNGVAQPVVSHYVVLPWEPSAQQFEGQGLTYAATDH